MSTAEAGAVFPAATVFHGPSCTGAIPAAGDARVVRCQYCNADVHLPAELLQTVKKSAKKMQWWMFLER